ncbi:hypothetical protein [Corallococcus sp. AB038B]|uniref:hypothetical protein n=1 Tax=Corallococcus sp. AB038B TaxID=2316718 RepID=UPI0011C37851|nr:hypothetical protein [Corallococcus sp. AB038B]
MRDIRRRTALRKGSASRPSATLKFCTACQAMPFTPVNGPLGFCMQFTRAIFILGLLSMLLYFVFKPKLALEKLLPEAPLFLHLALGSP